MNHSVFIGWDPRESAAFAVARQSCKKYLTMPIPITGLVLDDLKARGLYTRPMEFRQSAADRPIMWDVISDWSMATEFACSRFLVPELAKTGWALFCDCDMLFRSNVARMFDNLDPKYAVYVVKHDYRPTNTVKMDNQIQSRYNRKLWSAFCVFNCDHPSNGSLTVEYVNSVPGRDMHAFKWLRDDEIGELDPAWHWLPRHSPYDIEPKCIHYSEGGPWFDGYHDEPFSNEWRAELNRWAS